jgi:uncharacterized protein (TIGR00251 family)
VVLRIVATATGVRLSIRVQPRASSNAVAGVHGEALKIRLTAPPVEGAANEALVVFLAQSLGITRRDVTIVAGSSSRSKIVELAGITEDRVRKLLDS